MSELWIELQQRDDAVVVKMSGDAAVANIGDLEQQFIKLQAMRPKIVVLDMSDLSFIASIGMGTIVALNRSVSRAGGAVKLAGVNEHVLGAFQRAGLDKVFEIHDTPDAALG